MQAADALLQVIAELRMQVETLARERDVFAAEVVRLTELQATDASD